MLQLKCRLLQLFTQELVFSLECFYLIVALGLKHLKDIHVFRLFVRQFFFVNIELGLEKVRLFLVLVFIPCHILSSLLQIFGLLDQLIDRFLQLFYLVLHFNILQK